MAHVPLFPLSSAVPRNLLLRFKDDSIDESNTLAQVLQSSPTLGEVLDLSVRTLPGDHLRLMQQALVDVPPEVARVASSAVFTGGELIGEMMMMTMLRIQIRTWFAASNSLPTRSHLRPPGWCRQPDGRASGLRSHHWSLQGGDKHGRGLWRTGRNCLEGVGISKNRATTDKIRSEGPEQPVAWISSIPCPHTMLPHLRPPLRSVDR